MPPKRGGGARRGRGSNAPGDPSLAEQVNLLDNFQQNIYPGVAARDMIIADLRASNWNLDAAIAAWRTRRQALLSQQAEGEPQVPANNAVSESSSSPSSPTSTASPPSTPSPPPPNRPVTVGRPIPRRNATSAPAKLILRLHMRNSRPPPRASQVTAAQSAVPFNENHEQERRDAALALRLHMEELIGEEGLISPAEAILMLNRRRWDLTQTAKEFRKLIKASRRETTLLRLARTYDQMRTPLQQEVAPPQQGTISMQQSERLAELLNITGRNDWHSLRVCLQSHNWNLVAAVSQWFTQGIPPVQAPSSVEHGGVRLNTNLHQLPMPTWDDTRSASSLEGWAIEPEEFAKPGEADSDSSSEEGTGLIKQDRKRLPGFLINASRATAKKGMRNNSLFLIEYISRGRYWYNRFEQQANLKWPGVGFPTAPHGQNPKPDQSKLVEFDWTNQRHVDWLNNWRRQNCDRVTGLKKRAEAQKWSEEELQFLYDLSAELLDKKKKESPHLPEDHFLPLRFDKDIKEDWRVRFNNRFRGTVQPGCSQPRLDREQSAIMTQRARTRAIVDRFRVKADVDYFKKIDAAKKAREDAAAEARGEKRSREHEDDNSDDGVLETDSEDEDSHKDKRARTGEDEDKE
ncbi:hypothetical protein LTR84_002977 [Exophiala bonariae]|uniref:Uncharacterized protein n=1 Tax=Exophiala bonariae TaxID=1690606 RepID=A0AAV9N7P4_9EURO|nr:hypothetical protein LTR84_002977 [Exophiala bonariae]